MNALSEQNKKANEIWGRYVVLRNAEKAKFQQWAKTEVGTKESLEVFTENVVLRGFANAIFWQWDGVMDSMIQIAESM